MDVMQAARIAADYVAMLERLTIDPDEPNTSNGLLREIHFAVEGTHFDEADGRWRIEVGFSRPWDQARSPLAGIASVPTSDNRTYKALTIDDSTGKVLAYERM
jgi:hypothetical protein